MIYGELIERSVWRDGVLVDIETTLTLTNISGFAIDMDLQLETAIWAERVDITYFRDGDILNLGVVSKDTQAFNAAITSIWFDLDYWWISLKPAV